MQNLTCNNDVVAIKFEALGDGILLDVAAIEAHVQVAALPNELGMCRLEKS
jgi:hypothetical protein